MHSTVDLILHPVRMRIIQSLIGEKAYTVQQMMEHLPDIPQATLYRQLNTLTKAGIVKVVEENRVRGTVERVYALGGKGSHPITDATEKSRDEHLQFFMGFVAKLLDDFGAYTNQTSYNLVEDGVGFRQAAVHMSDEEFTAFVTQVRELIQQAMANPPSPERKLRLIANIFMPETRNDS